jgi:hypothetical protein
LSSFSQAGQRSGEVAAGGPWLASDQRCTFVERVAVFVVERHHRALAAGETTVGAVEVHIGFVGWLRVDIDGVGEPESGEQAPACPNRAANANLAQPGDSLRRIAQGVPRPPRQLHRFLNGVLGLLGVPQDGVGDGEQPAALGMDSGFKPWRNARRLIVSHDHETIEPA